MSARPGANFLSRVRATIDDRGLLRGGEHVLLAVSGGPDSLSLLHAFADLATSYRLRLHVGHFDHALRDDSASDARFVARAARALDIPCTIARADSIEPLPKQSPEESARTRRYGFLNDLARELGASRIATGHTLDDQAETVLMRVLVGAGRRGLSGIPPRRWFTIRPLIDVRRADVEAFCRARKLRPRIDPTNADPSHLRNVLRHEVLPLLTTRVNARLPETLARLGDLVRDEDYYLDGLAASAAKPEQVGDDSRISIEALRAMPVALQRRAIRLLARNEGPGIDAARTDAVRVMALDAKTGKKLDLPGSLRARVEYGFLVLGRTPSPKAPAAAVELGVPGETDLPPWGVAVRSWITVERPARWPDGRWMCVLDADRVALPLRARRWRSGDRFRPIGMTRQKKVGDFFTDEKVPQGERGDVPLIVDDDGTVVWIAGHRIDDRAKVTLRTERNLWLSIQGGTT